MPELDSQQGLYTVAKNDIHPLRLLRSACFTVLALGLVIVLAAGLLDVWQTPMDAGPDMLRTFSSEKPLLEAGPEDERAAYFAEKERYLNAYEWVDREAGIARIPIDVAMEMLAARDRAGGGRP